MARANLSTTVTIQIIPKPFLCLLEVGILRAYFLFYHLRSKLYRGRTKYSLLLAPLAFYTQTRSNSFIALQMKHAIISIFTEADLGEDLGFSHGSALYRRGLRRGAYNTTEYDVAIIIIGFIPCTTRRNNSPYRS